MNPIQTLNETEIFALKDTLGGEHNSCETYAQVIRDFGSGRQIITIVEVGARYISALPSLFEEHVVSPPANRWSGLTPRLAGLHEACVPDPEREVENVPLFDRALLTKRYLKNSKIFYTSRWASQDSRPPDFQRWVQRG